MIDSQFVRWLGFRVLGLLICTRIGLGFLLELLIGGTWSNIRRMLLWFPKRWCQMWFKRQILVYFGILGYKCGCTLGVVVFVKWLGGLKVWLLMALFMKLIRFYSCLILVPQFDSLFCSIIFDTWWPNMSDFCSV